MNITIDGQRIEITEDDKNIVDVADRSKLAIPAACYRAKQSKGCCHACVVEIFGEQKYACATKPVDGMQVILNREDLKELRKERLLKYQEGIKIDNPCECNSACSSDCCD